MQCKAWAAPVGSPVVQALLGAAVIHQARPVLALSGGGLTSAARDLSRRQGVEVVTMGGMATLGARPGQGRADRAGRRKRESLHGRPRGPSQGARPGNDPDAGTADKTVPTLRLPDWPGQGEHHVELSQP
ncbi:MAG: restriction endonuclease [Acidimicrobiales bacterium]